jgi:hypothetical protein
LNAYRGEQRNSLFHTIFRQIFEADKETFQTSTDFSAAISTDRIQKRETRSNVRILYCTQMLAKGMSSSASDKGEFALRLVPNRKHL